MKNPATKKADNGKGFKVVPKGKEKGEKKFVPPWMKDKKKK